MNGRDYTDPNGVTWTFTQRAYAREGEALTHVTLSIESAWETRIVSCARAEWDRDLPDYTRLLEKSVPVGASRGLDRQDVAEAPPENPEF